MQCDGSRSKSETIGKKVQRAMQLEMLTASGGIVDEKHLGK